MSELTWHAVPNHIFVAIPERYEQPKGPRSPEGLALTVLSGDDAWNELTAVLKQGGNKVHFEERGERSIQNIVRVGQVLQLPNCLDNTMTLGGGGPKGVRTFADLTLEVAVGDTVFLDYSYITDANEVYPGVYKLPYSAVICKIEPFEVDMGEGIEPEYGEIRQPVGGYVLLGRVWADDVEIIEHEGLPRKCRLGKTGLIDEIDVAPLSNEGIVAHLAPPLKGSPDELREGQRVIVDPRFARAETICGQEHLITRHDFVVAIKEPALEQ